MSSLTYFYHIAALFKIIGRPVKEYAIVRNDLWLMLHMNFILGEDKL